MSRSCGLLKGFSVLPLLFRCKNLSVLRWFVKTALSFLWWTFAVIILGVWTYCLWTAYCLFSIFFYTLFVYVCIVYGANLQGGWALVFIWGYEHILRDMDLHELWYIIIMRSFMLISDFTWYHEVWNLLTKALYIYLVMLLSIFLAYLPMLSCLV